MSELERSLARQRWDTFGQPLIDLMFSRLLREGQGDLIEVVTQSNRLTDLYV